MKPSPLLILGLGLIVGAVLLWVLTKGNPNLSQESTQPCGKGCDCVPPSKKWVNLLTTPTPGFGNEPFTLPKYIYYNTPLPTKDRLGANCVIVPFYGGESAQDTIGGSKPVRYGDIVQIVNMRRGECLAYRSDGKAVWEPIKAIKSCAALRANLPPTIPQINTESCLAEVGKYMHQWCMIRKSGDASGKNFGKAIRYGDKVEIVTLAREALSSPRCVGCMGVTQLALNTLPRFSGLSGESPSPMKSCKQVCTGKTPHYVLTLHHGSPPTWEKGSSSSNPNSVIALGVEKGLAAG